MLSAVKISATPTTLQPEARPIRREALQIRAARRTRYVFTAKLTLSNFVTRHARTIFSTAFPFRIIIEL